LYVFPVACVNFTARLKVTKFRSWNEHAFLAMVVTHMLKTQLKHLCHNSVQTLLQTQNITAVVEEFGLNDFSEICSKVSKHEK